MIDEVQIVSESGSEPVTTAEAKIYLEVDFSDDDTLISSLITSARKFIEKFCSVSLLAKTVKMIGSGKIEADLEYYPVDSSTIAVTDENSGTVSFDRLGDKQPHVIINGASKTRYTIQYDTTANTDEVFKIAIKMLVKWMYSNASFDQKSIGFTPFIEDKNYQDAIKIIEPYKLR